MKIIGVLSDTHLETISSSFTEQCAKSFSRCDMIIHAGDLTDVSILSAFSDKVIHCVSGNSCNPSTKFKLPLAKEIIVEGYRIGITHGAGNRHNIEDRVYHQFPTADCIIFGHTHQPICHRIGDTLLLNPGSFKSTGKYGAPGTFGLLYINENSLQATIHTLGENL